MAWLDNLLNHFALYPAHLFELLFVMALSKSTVLDGNNESDETGCQGHEVDA